MLRSEAMLDIRVDLPMEKIAAFCRKWKVVELALFGSALREDFRPDSDIDLLATFADDAEWSLLDHAQMELELMGVLKREVDLLTRGSVEHSGNPIRRQEILESARSIYRAA
jgi:predicted nucleotidyltransferase